MAQPNHTPRLAEPEEALTVLFCLIDDAYALLNPDIERIFARLPELQGVESHARSCATHRGSSRTCSPGWWGFILPRFIGG